ncbi:hypothetical protein GGS26DRAFT_101520 [Hypomontagnella submonticulosa]|nr:hypothetical protein GGS26DRAFT_101520 [Hypomontagnella submonticulosa]
MASALSNLGVQYMPSTGACMLDMAAVPAGMFDACSAIHIRIPEQQQRIDVHSGMICIQPSQPASGPSSSPYHEQYKNPGELSPPDLPQASPKEQPQQPPSFQSPQGPLPGPNPGSPIAPSDYHEDYSSTMTTRVRPTQASTIATTTFTSFPSRASHLSQSSTFISQHFSSSTAVRAPTPTALPLPPVPQRPTPAPAPTHPVVAAPSVAPKGPAPEPEYCGTSYVKMDLTSIDTLDPHDLDLYLNLLGLHIHLPLDLGLDDLGLGDLGLDDIDSDGLLGGLLDDLDLNLTGDDTAAVATQQDVRRELERSYRVRCGVSESISGFRGGSGSNSRLVTAPTQTRCLEECEKGAMAHAREGQVAECLGAAWRRTGSRDNCRFWTGGKDEFLPVEKLPAGERGMWDLVYA